MPTRPRFRRLAAWLGGAVVLAVLLAVGLPYLYLHYVKSPAPAALTVGAAPSSAGTASPRTGLAGTWRVAAGSRAGYRVDEVLGGQATTAVGRTDAVTGELTVVGTRATEGAFRVDLTKVTSDSDRRDGQFQGRIMETARYPTATFTLTEPAALDALATATGPVPVPATGTLALHGVTRPTTVALTAVRSGETVQVGGQVPVTFADHGIANPSFGDVVKTGDTGTIELLLTLEKQ